MGVRRIFVLVLMLAISPIVKAQLFFYSGDSVSFPKEVINVLNRIDTESARKVAYDFRSVWDYEITDEQRSLVLRISEKMVERRLPVRPYHEYFFAYLTYSVKQAGINEYQLTKVLTITKHAAYNYTNPELKKFLLSLNLFFAREYLYWGPSNYTKSNGGVFTFESLEEEAPIETAFEEPLETPDTSEFITDEEINQLNANDPWANNDQGNDDWANDPWGNNDQSNDPWGNDDQSNDDWANSNQDP